MRLHRVAGALLGAAGLLAAGWGAYQWGLQQGTRQQAGGASSPAEIPPPAIDPAGWSVPEGEAATRRHLAEGLKAGDLDPQTQRRILYYQDPMVPGTKFEAPGKSPFMEMMLVPVYAGAEGADAGTVRISPRIAQNLGLRTAHAVLGQLRPRVVAVGNVLWNERGRHLLQARASGFVERLHVRATLDSVQAGQALLDLHIPDWIAAQEDFLSLRRMALAPTDSRQLLDAARARMRQVGMGEAQIARIEREDRIDTRITLTAPTAGVVTELPVREGSTVLPGALLVRLDTLDSVWIEADVPERQSTLLRPGGEVSIRAAAWPGETLRGKVQALLPVIDPDTRTRRIRVEAANPEARLLPGMFVEMTLEAPPSSALLIPSEALIRSGRRSLVMLAEPDGRYRPAEVEVGLEEDGHSEILRGLSAGDAVVLSSQFLLDSEASLKGVLARTDQGDPPVAPDAARIAGESHHTPARVEAVHGDVLTLTHPAIPSLQWPGMTMDFQLGPGLDANALQSGQEIEVEFILRAGQAPEILRYTPAAKTPDP